MSPNEEIAIIGAGHGGCAAAGDFGRQGFRVRLWSRSDHTLAHLRHRGGIELSGEPGEHFVPIPLITNDIGEAVRGARVVMLCVPHRPTARSPLASPRVSSKGRSSWPPPVTRCC